MGATLNFRFPYFIKFPGVMPACFLIAGANITLKELTDWYGEVVDGTCPVGENKAPAFNMWWREQFNDIIHALEFDYVLRSARYRHMNVQPVTLVGSIVRLEPMKIEHAKPLADVGREPELWRLQPAPVSTPDDMRRYVSAAIDQCRAGESLPFVIVNRSTEQVIGTSRYMDIARAHRRLEIGATWLAPSHQRTGANTEAKLLLLTHAFESLGVQRVVFKTEVLNEQSRAALLRLGAVQEGIFRKHLIADSGRPRDMVYFSILDNEWPAVKDRLNRRLSDRSASS